MTAVGTVNARKPVVRICAFQEAIDDALFEQPLQSPLGSQFGYVAVGALVKRARTGVARAITEFHGGRIAAAYNTGQPG